MKTTLNKMILKKKKKKFRKHNINKEYHYKVAEEKKTCLFQTQYHLTSSRVIYIRIPFYVKS